MKKTNKPTGAKKPAQQRPGAKAASAKPLRSQALSRPDLLHILEWLARSTERLARAAEQVPLATARIPAAAARRQEPEPQAEGAGEVVGLMVVDEGDEEWWPTTSKQSSCGRGATTGDAR